MIYKFFMNSIIIKKRLDSDVIKLGTQAKFLLGKNVEIVIRELITPQLNEKKWNHLGGADLGGKTDHIHIRNFAHDD